MNIYSVALNIHDHNTYDGQFHNQIERHNRVKHNLDRKNPHNPIPSRKFFLDHVLPQLQARDEDNVFALTVSNLGQEFVTELMNRYMPTTEFLEHRPHNLWQCYFKDNIYYIDHHQSHACYALLSSGWKESDILAIDGRGWKFSCVFMDRVGNITDLSGKIPIGGLWNRLAQDIGFNYLDAGKVMGLAGYGKYSYQAHAMIEAYLMNPNHKLPQWASTVISLIPKEDIAYTLQHVTIELIKKYVYPLKSCDKLCVAGGVAYNGYMNEELTKHYSEVHVPPAVGDEGQAIGTYMHAQYFLEDKIHNPSVYAGKEHRVDESVFDGLNYSKYDWDDLVNIVAEGISRGKIVGWYQGKSESGNRALGNRSILADPRNPMIKDIINNKIKKREDFRPFAPSVLEEHYQQFFDTSQTSPYMSRIMPVKSEAIPGVTHVDGSARIQTVNKEQNQKFYDVINAFYKKTDIPMLLNTSFNCQEPIVETPQDAVNTFKNTDLDLLVVGDYVAWK